MDRSNQPKPNPNPEPSSKGKRGRLKASAQIDARRGVARQDMALGLAGLIRPKIQAKRDKKGRLTGGRQYVEGLPQTWAGGDIIWSGPQLDAFDLQVHLACQALALQASCDGETKLTQGANVAGLLVKPPKGGQANMADDRLTLELETSMSAVCLLIGRSPDDGRAHISIRASLTRLASIVVTASQDDEAAFTHLIGGGAFSGRNAIRLTLSYRLTQAVLGEGSYARIRLAEFARLNPVAQLVYHWLACWRPGAGSCKPIGLDKLAAHVWGACEDGATVRERRQQLKAALASLPDDEWDIKLLDGNLVQITRKKGLLCAA